MLQGVTPRITAKIATRMSAVGRQARENNTARQSIGAVFSYLT
jgi:hypothetical protein